MTVYDEYEKYTKQYQKEYGIKTIVLYQCGSFYEVYSANDGLINIKEIADILNIHIAKKNSAISLIDRNNTQMAGFPLIALSKFIKLLVNEAYTVIVVSQVSPPPSPKRAVTNIISNGTQLDDLNPFESNILLVAVFEEFKQLRQKKTVLGCGISLIDLTSGKSFVAEYIGTPTDTNLALDELYQIISLYQPKEILFSSSEKINLSYDELIAYFGITSRICLHNKLEKYPKEMMKISYQEQLLKKVFPLTGLLSHFEYLNLDRRLLATQSYIYLLNFCYQHNEGVLKNIMRPNIIDNKAKHCNVSYNAAQQLGIDNLVKILNKCKTAIGRRGFKERLLTPLLDTDKIQTSYKIIEYILQLYNKENTTNTENTNTRQTIDSTLDQIYDIERLFRWVCLQKLHPSDIERIVETMKAIIKLIKILEIDSLFECSIHNRTDEIVNLIEALGEVFNFPIAGKTTMLSVMSKTANNFFNIGIYPQLDTIQDQINKYINTFSQLAAQLHTSFVKVEYTEKEGYYLTLTKLRYQEIKKDWQDAYIIDKWIFETDKFTIKTMTSNVKITCPIINKLNQEINKLRNKLGDSILEKYRKFLDNFAKEYDIFNTLIQYIADMDWYISCAKNAYDYQYYMPTILDKFNGNSYLQAQQIRHPIIERILKYENYVPNDIELGTDKQLGILLYGVNSAGKSSISKAIALNIIMAQAGMFIPSKLKYFPYNEIFTRIPSGDNEMQGKSTFIVEMSEFRNILRRATSRSLVISDELASGTESISALSLVGSGIYKLCDLGASFISATHLHGLTDISHVKQLTEDKKIGIYHLSVQYDMENECLIYDRTMQPGQGSTLYGLEVAKSLDLGTDFINLANKIRHEVLENSPDLLHKKKSRYNAELYVDVCVICGTKADEVHHIQPQMLANKRGFIGDIHKNKLSNLIAICSICHDQIHNGKVNVEGFKQTSDCIKLIVNKS